MNQNELIENEQCINLANEINQFGLEVEQNQNRNFSIQTFNKEQKQHDQFSRSNYQVNLICQKQSLQHFKTISKDYNLSQNNNMANVIEMIQKNMTRITFRCFFNRFMTYYIKSLKYQQQSIRLTSLIEIKKFKQQNWPFKQLFYKKNRNQDDQIMFQFVNMCAQKIQSVFKCYMTRKRHLFAISKLKKFKNHLSNAVRSWKLWNIYNCKRAKQLKSVVKSINLQIQRQIQNPNIDRHMKRKKIEYLNKNQQIAKQNFRTFLFQIYKSGAWIFQVDKCFKKDNFQKNNKNITSLAFKSNEEIITQVAKVQPVLIAGRKRDFQAPRNRNIKKQSKQNQKQQIQNYSSINHNKSSELSTNYQSTTQQRPIVSKGQYKLDQNIQNQFLNKNQEKIQKNKQITDKQSYQIVDSQYQEKRKQNLTKIQERKKMNKRQKYDPRKAIEEQKQKKLEHKTNDQQKIEQQTLTKPNEKIQSKNIASKTPNKISKKTPLKIKKEQKKFDSPQDSSKQKTVEKTKKQNKLTKKDDNNKSLKNIFNPKKVVSRVDCWGSKKDNSSLAQNTINEQSSYRSKYLIGLKQKNQEKVIKTQGSQKDIRMNRLKNRFQKQLSSRQQQEEYDQKQQYSVQKKANEATYQSSYLKKLVEERQKGSFSYTNKGILNIRIAQKIKQQQKNMPEQFEQINNKSNNKRTSDYLAQFNNRKNSNVGQKIQKKIQIQTSSVNSNIRKKQEVYRPVQSLQEVYSSQYSERYNNLKNKLNMLQSTRHIQKNGSIPILLEQARFMKKIYNEKEHTFSTLYWPQVRTMQTSFLEYIKFNVTSNAH